MIAQIIFQANRKATERMQSLIHGLSEQELSKTIPDHWSIAGILAHLAVWDQRVIHVLAMVDQEHGLNVPVFDMQLNDILAPILATIPPAEAAGLAVQTAGELDQLLEQCPAELIDRMMTVNSRLVERSLHRNAHLDEIESILQAGA